MTRRANKYGNIKVQADGYTFDSKMEHRRYLELKLLETAVKIINLKVHPSFEIYVKEILVCRVELDFSYRVVDDHYEDVKGTDNALSRLKRKLVEAAYGISVEVIKKVR